MVIENLVLIIFALALLLITTTILVYSWLITHEKYLGTGIWMIRLLVIIPGFLALIGALYFIATKSETRIGMALFTAGILLVTGAIRLMLLLMKKRVELSKPSD